MHWMVQKSIWQTLIGIESFECFVNNKQLCSFNFEVNSIRDKELIRVRWHIRDGHITLDGYKEHSGLAILQ